MAHILTAILYKVIINIVYYTQYTFCIYIHIHTDILCTVTIVYYISCVTNNGNYM